MPVDLPFRLRDVEEVDDYDASDLTTELPVSLDISLPFLGLQDNAENRPAAD